MGPSNRRGRIPTTTPTTPGPGTSGRGAQASLRYDKTATLRPVRWVFVVFGLFWGAWAVAAIDIEHSLRLSTGGYGLLLSVSLAGSAAANAIGGGLCERFGTRRVLGIALASWALFLVAGAAARDPVLLGAAIVLIIVNAGMVDVTINVASMTALADEPGRLVAFHAWFNAGAAAGAATCGALLAAHLSWRWLWVAVALVVAVLAGVCGRSPLPGAQRGEPVPWHGALRLMHEEQLFVLAGIFALAAMIEGGIDLWGVLYLRSQLDSGLLLGAGGAVLGYSVAALARTTLGPRVGRKGPPRGVAIGAGTAALGIVLLTSAPGAALGALGLVLAAGGISMCWPLLVAAAGRDRPRAAAAVGAVTAGGYLGLVAGPAVVGWTADAVGLRGALGLLAGAAVIVAVVSALRPRLLIGAARSA
jgi:MFS family permease